MYLSDELDSFFAEEVSSNLWEVVGNFLDKLLMLFDLIVFLDSNVLIMDKSIVLFGLVIFFVSSWILKWSFFGGELGSCDRNLDNRL